jgi:competence protein ComEC
MAAQIGVLPLSLYYFHQFPGLFFVSNLVIIPFLGIILLAGIVVILLAALGGLPQILAKSYMLLIQGMNYFVSWISNQEVFIIQNITFSIALLIGFYVFILSFFKWVEKKNFKRLAVVFITVISIQLAFIVEKYELQSRNEFVIFHKSRGQVIGNRFGDKLQIRTSINNLSERDNPLKSYVVGAGIQELAIKDSIQHFFKIIDHKILVVDSLGIYKFKNLKPAIIVLQQSPKINLERLIKLLEPKLIVADGSNYKSYLKSWEKSCLKNKTPFYSTSQNGAFQLNY